MPRRFKFVFIPADTAEPLQQWELDMPEGKEVECLIDRLKASGAARLRAGAGTGCGGRCTQQRAVRTALHGPHAVR